MDKYQKAIVRYETARASISDATAKINYWTCGYFDGEKFVNDHICRFSHTGDDTCVEKLWDANRQNARVDNCFYNHEYDCDCAGGEVEIPDLCDACKQVQFHVDERKKFKKELGIAKRQLSALAKGLMKNG